MTRVGSQRNSPPPSPQRERERDRARLNSELSKKKWYKMQTSVDKIQDKICLPGTPKNRASAVHTFMQQVCANIRRR